jgi:glutathione synthase/RimK-type ligase-like ATP-grasp enzyme
MSDSKRGGARNVNSTRSAGRVLLTSTNDWSNGARLAMGFADAGCKVYAAYASGNPFSRTRAVDRSFSYSGLHPLKSLKTAIRVTRPHLLVPCDDLAVEHLHELHAWASDIGPAGKALTNLIERSIGHPDAYVTVSTRYTLMELALKEGLRVPHTALIRKVSDFEPWRAQHGFPWVLKLDGTSGGEGVRIAHTLDEAEHCFHSLSKLFRPVQTIKRVLAHGEFSPLRAAWKGFEPAIIVQRYIPGRAANCAVACWKGSMLAGIAVEVVSSKGPTGPACIVRVIDNREMLHCAKKIGRRLGTTGFFGLDFVLEAGTGAAYLLEMNPRSTPLSHFQLGHGRDLISALWAQASGNPIREKPAVTQCELIAYFPDAWTYGTEYLKSSFHDVPNGEPDLIRALLNPHSFRNSVLRLLGRKVGTVS